MINLDDHASFRQIDRDGMLSHIDGLPDQLEQAWNLGQRLDLPKWDGIQRVLVSGMGGSAIGADLLAAYLEPYCHAPIVVQRDYDLPAWARSKETLVIASSHSGNTEETLSGFDRALKQGCRCLAVTTGGKLGKAAEESGTPLWTFQHEGQPRAAVGFSFGLLLAALARLDLIPDLSIDVAAAVSTMKQQQSKLLADIPAVNNPAKRMGGQLMGRWVTVIGAGVLAPVARRWKGQINELAKAWAQFEALPEANHNTLAGVVNPDELLSKTMVLFLRAPSYHPRNLLRTNLTKTIFMLEGLNTDFVDATGETSLEHLWSVLHYGDYSAFYLAMAYGMDPTPVVAIDGLKNEMAESGELQD